MEARDLDGDGDLDLISVVDDIRVLAWTNINGAGTFGEVDTLLVLPAPVAHYILEDLNGDGAVDMLFVTDDQELELAWNTGAGALDTPEELADLDHTPGALRVGDLTGNGWLDVVITFAEDEEAGIIYWPNTAGNFAEEVQIPSLLPGAAPTVVTVGDLDGNGAQDIFVVASDLAAVGLMNGAGNGTTWDILPLFFNYDYPLVRPQLIDVDGDGDLDLAEANGLAVQWVENKLNTNAGNFEIHVVAPFTSAGAGQFAHLGCNASAGVFYVPSNPGLQPRWSNHLPEIHGFAPRKVLTDIQRGLFPRFADLDGDARPDLIIVRSTGAQWYPNILVPPTTEVFVPQFDTLCTQGPSVQLPAALPAEGEWSGVWVQNGELFRQNATTTGDYPLDYTFYEEAGCPVGDQAFIHLATGPTVSPSVGPILCSAERPIQLSARPTNVEWVGLTTDGILDPTLFTGGVIVCAFTDTTGISCVSFLGPISVWPSVSADIQEAGPFCITEGVQTILPVADLPGTTWSGDIVSSTNGSALFDPAQGAGEYQVILDRVPTIPQQCANSDTLLITIVDDVPQVSVTPFPVYCADGPVVPLSGGIPEGGVWSGPGVENDTLDPALVGSGPQPVFYDYTNAAGCTATAVLFIELASEASVETTERDFCPEDGSVQFVATPTGGAWSTPLDASGMFDPGATLPGNYPLGYTYTAPNGCVLINQPDTIAVLAPTEVSIDAQAVYCLDAGEATLFGSQPGLWSGAVSGTGSSVPFDPADLGLGVWTVTLAVDPVDGCYGETSTQIVVETCIGLAEHDGALSIRIAPNPFTERTVLHLDMVGPVLVEVLDATGRLVFDRTFSAQGRSTVDIDLGGEAAGTYLLRVRSDGAAEHLRLVKSR